MPGFHWSRSLAPAPASRWAKDRITPSTWSTSSACGWPSSRTAWCSALDSGRRSALVGAGLELAGAPVPAYGRRAQRVEQHRLADAAQPGEHQAALGAAARDPLEHDVEGAQLLVATGQLGRALAGAGRVRVPDRVHDRTVSGVSSRALDFPGGHAVDADRVG